MKPVIILYPAIFLIMTFSFCCKSQPANSANNIVLKNKIDDTLYLNTVDTSFYSYMPDTSRAFKVEDERRKYLFGMQKKYRDYKKTFRMNFQETKKNNIALDIQNADIMFDDYMQVVNYKSLNAQMDKKRNMELLIFQSPFSNFSKVESAISLYESFETKYKKNESGIKVFKHLNSLKFDKNIDVNITGFPGTYLLDLLAKKIIAINAISNLKEYNILSFGASWCLPCRLGDLQLKQWFTQMDTTRISICSFSVDNDFNKWKQYLKEDSPLWPTYLLEKGMNNIWVNKLQLESIPAYFLLDSNGNILAENTDIRKILKKIPILNTSDQYVK